MVSTHTVTLSVDVVSSTPEVDVPPSGLQAGVPKQVGFPETGVDLPVSAIDPLVLGGVTVVALVALVGGWQLVRWIRRQSGVRFREAIESTDRITVLMHPNPDPDAMSSAIGVRALASAVDTDVTLQYPGRIQHQENRAFETVLDLDMERVVTSDDLADGEVVLVDHNVPRGFAGADSIDAYAVVDHHPGEGEGGAFTDVRPEYGACASILAEYFRELDADVLGPGDDPPEGNELVLTTDVATGLMYGIQSDTDHLTNGCSTAEFEACEFLFPGVDEETLSRIANPQVDADVLDAKARAITDREVDGPFVVADVGEVNNVDAIPQSADELVRLEGVTAVIVYGESDGTIHLSGRSRDDRVHMGNVLEVVVSDIPMAGAGGHARMGGGQIQRDHMEGLGPQQGITVTDLKGRLFDAMRGDIQ